MSTFFETGHAKNVANLLKLNQQIATYGLTYNPSNNALVFKHGLKMKAAVAVQRKILELSFIVFKNNTIYNHDYISESIKNQ